MLTSTDWTQLRRDFVTRKEHEDAFGYLVKNMATKEDLRNLEERIDNKFDQIDTKFEQVDARFDQIDARFEQIDIRFEQIDVRFEQMDGKFNQIMTTLDGIAGGVQDMRLENSVSASQYARQLEWNQRVAKKIDVPFDY